MSSATPTKLVTGFLFRHNDHNGETMPYVVYVPRNYTPGAPSPAIMFLHGRGESGTDGHKQVIQGLGANILWNADRWPCIVIFPQKPEQGRMWNTHAEQVIAILADVRREWSIDPNRIALTGLSQGGYGTWTIAAKYPDVWCAIAPICGFMDSNGGSANENEIAARVKNLPIWTFHGDADDVVSISQTRRVVDALSRAGATPKFTIYPGVNHNSWDRAYAEKDLPAFLLTPKSKQ